MSFHAAAGAKRLAARPPNEIPIMRTKGRVIEFLGTKFQAAAKRMWYVT